MLGMFKRDPKRSCSKSMSANFKPPWRLHVMAICAPTPRLLKKRKHCLPRSGALRRQNSLFANRHTWLTSGFSAFSLLHWLWSWRTLPSPIRYIYSLASSDYSSASAGSNVFNLRVSVLRPSPAARRLPFAPAGMFKRCLDQNPLKIGHRFFQQVGMAFGQGMIRPITKRRAPIAVGAAFRSAG